MAPSRIIFIRHAEKPTDTDQGVSAKGEPDPECLTPRGWQRAGALARFFCPHGGSPMMPTRIYATGLGRHSPSHRPRETVEPLAALLGAAVPFDTDFLKDDGAALIDDVTSQNGIVLVSWQHELIPTLVGYIPGAPAVPQTWPDDRFDVIWILDPAPSGGWTFRQVPQLLLAGDSDSVIPFLDVATPVG